MLLHCYKIFLNSSALGVSIPLTVLILTRTVALMRTLCCFSNVCLQLAKCDALLGWGYW